MERYLVTFKFPEDDEPQQRVLFRRPADETPDDAEAFGLPGAEIISVEPITDEE